MEVETSCALLTGAHSEGRMLDEDLEVLARNLGISPSDIPRRDHFLVGDLADIAGVQVCAIYRLIHKDDGLFQFQTDDRYGVKLIPFDQGIRYLRIYRSRSPKKRAKIDIPALTRTFKTKGTHNG